MPNATPDLATIVIVPGLRDDVAEHWQTLLAAQLRATGRTVVGVPPMGRADLDCARRVAAIEAVMQGLAAPRVLVAHSGGVIMLAHWAQQHAARLAPGAIRGALLATPPDFDRPLPEGQPALEALRIGGWLPVPRRPLPFPSLVAASRNDPLGSFERVAALAADWGSELVDLGPVGHLNPASGYGPWPEAVALIERLEGGPAAACADR